MLYYIGYKVICFYFSVQTVFQAFSHGGGKALSAHGSACPERAAQTGAEARTAEKRRAGIRGTLTYVHFRGFKFNIPFSQSAQPSRHETLRKSLFRTGGKPSSHPSDRRRGFPVMRKSLFRRAGKPVPPARKAHIARRNGLFRKTAKTGQRDGRVQTDVYQRITQNPKLRDIQDGNPVHTF